MKKAITIYLKIMGRWETLPLHIDLAFYNSTNGNDLSFIIIAEVCKCNKEIVILTD